jgi:DNA repair ATPase RecN
MAVKKKVVAKKSVKPSENLVKASTKRKKLEEQTIPAGQVTEESAQKLTLICEAAANKLEEIVKEAAKGLGLEVELHVFLDIKNFSRKKAN